MWERLPADGRRYELLDGTLVVTPSPSRTHQVLVVRLVVALAAYVERHNLGQVWAGPIDVFAGPRTVLEPDVAVELGTDVLQRQSWRDLVGPALAVEILSPASARYDRGAKRDVYLARGAEYWIVDAEARAIERWTPAAAEASVHRDAIAWRAAPTIPALILDLAQLFANLPSPESGAG